MDANRLLQRSGVGHRLVPVGFSVLLFQPDHQLIAHFHCGRHRRRATIGALAFSGVPVVAPTIQSFSRVGNATSAIGLCPNGGLYVTGITTIGSSHTINEGFSSAVVNFSSGVHVGGGIGWLIGNVSLFPAAPTWSWTGSSYYTGLCLAFAPIAPEYPVQFQRIQTTPVITKGATYGTVVANALAAPSACWNGSQWALAVSIWNIATSKWSSVFFTSTDLATWTYVSGSIVSPSGGDYIIGNSGLAWFNSKYYWAYNHYPVNSSSGVTLAYSTNLTSWTIVGDPIISSSARADPMLSVNPSSGNLELWTMVGSTLRSICLDTSSDGSTWTNNIASPVLATPSWVPFNFGEPSAFYTASGTRCLTCDGASTNGTRFIELFSGSSYTPSWIVHQAAPANSWESVQVFDSCCAGSFDRGDGLGPQFWMLYAGSDVVSATDNTDSSIGLCYLSSTFPFQSLFRPASLSLGAGGPFFATAGNG